MALVLFPGILGLIYWLCCCPWLGGFGGWKFGERVVKADGFILGKFGFGLEFVSCWEFFGWGWWWRLGAGKKYLEVS